MSEASIETSPETCVEVFSDRLHPLISTEATLIQLDNSSLHAEGPVYIPSEGSVVWSDVKGDRVLRWHDNTTHILREPAHFQNGNALDLEGRIVARSHGDRVSAA
ncbi:MAG: hypothetical protein AAF171_08640 [Cyanobacteria bacterium P01_A01_bin.116]